MRVRPDVPLVVLPGRIHPVVQAACWAVPGHVASRAAAALSHVDMLVDAARDADGRSLRELAPRTGWALRGLAKACVAVGGTPVGEELIARRAIHEYFGVRHSDDMSSAAVGLYAAVMCAWCVEDLASVALDASEVLAEVSAIRTVVAVLASAPIVEAAQNTRQARFERLVEWRPDGGAWHRWIVAHHLYLLLNLLAASSIRAGELDTALVQVRGMTATMLHSAALPGRWYQDVIRPTMRPPYCDPPLTGGAFLEHHAYRAALDGLLATDPPSEAFNRGRAALLAADLNDVERHAGMAYALVGGDPSLVQTDPDASAVADLFGMRTRRVERYAPFLRPGWVKA
jgi:hypothetical protein